MSESGFVFWSLAATAVLVHLKRWLAVQNVFAVAAILGGLGIGLALATPVGVGAAAENSSALHLIPLFHSRWDFPPFWIATVLSSRAAARLAAQTWTRPPIGALVLSAGLIPVFGVSAQCLAGAGTRTTLDGSASPWHDTAWRWGLEFAGWTVAGLITLVLIAPWLINKRSTREFHRSASLVIWLLPGLYLVGGLIQRGAWTRAAFLSGVMAVISLAGIRAIRRRDSGINSPRAG